VERRVEHVAVVAPVSAENQNHAPVRLRGIRERLRNFRLCINIRWIDVPFSVGLAGGFLPCVPPRGALTAMVNSKKESVL
jgi:hypothetical protein